MNNDQTFRLSSFNWRWLVVTYCFLVLFHLLPSSLVSGLTLFAIQHLVVPIFAWLGVGIFAVCAYVGYRSTVITLGEAGIASMLYVATLFIVLSKEWPPSFHYRVLNTIWLAPFLIVVFLAGLGGAAFGKWLQLRKQKKQAVREAI
jgi:hypothetical protein